MGKKKGEPELVETGVDTQETVTEVNKSDAIRAIVDRYKNDPDKIRSNKFLMAELSREYPGVSFDASLVAAVKSKHLGGSKATDKAKPKGELGSLADAVVTLRALIAKHGAEEVRKLIDALE